MPIQLKSGYSRKTVQENIAALARDHYPRPLAIRTAFNLARMCFFKEHAKGALPTWLAYPAAYRTTQYYNAKGEPVSPSRASNPVRELDIPKSEIAKIQHEIARGLTGQGADVRKAAARYTAFTGHEDVTLTKISIPDLPEALLQVGKCDGILYSTVRDGIAEKYIHKFNSRSRPLFCVSPDGKSLYLIGGSYNFTERGIVDKKP